MRLVTFRTDSTARLGALVEGGVLDLAAAGERVGTHLPQTLQQLIDAGQHLWDVASRVIDIRPDEDVTTNSSLLAPLPRPVRMRDASLMLEHMEVGLAKIGKTMTEEYRHQVLYYNVNHLSVVGTETDVPWPTRSEWIDFELEWACVLGRGGVNIQASAADDHIFGYTIFNDWSARDLQFAFMEGNIGPAGGKDFANSLGPCVVTADEIADPYALTMTARVNGELWTTGSTGSMHHRWTDTVASLSRDQPMVAGEVIGSGTVLGGCGFELDRRLAIGDLVELEVDGIGVLRNRVVAAA